MQNVFLLEFIDIVKQDTVLGVVGVLSPNLASHFLDKLLSKGYGHSFIKLTVVFPDYPQNAYLLGKRMAPN